MNNKDTIHRTLSEQTQAWHKYIIWGILALTALVFSNTLGNSFIENLDDNGYIIGNDMIRHLNWPGLKQMFSTFYLSNYHPLTIFSYAIEYKLFKLNPLPYHLDNLILHLFNTWLVYLFLYRFTGKIWVGIIASLFFGIHPMHVESVAWLAERKDLMYTFFFLLSLISYTRYLDEKKTVFILFTFILFLLSLLCKSAAVCLPLVLLLMNFYHTKNLTKKTLISIVPFLALSVLFGILAVLSQRATIHDISPYFDFFNRIFLVGYSTFFYLLHAFLPFNLCVIHYYPVKSGTLPFEYYLALPALCLLIWGVFKSGRFKHELIFGLLFYFITILLVLQILPVGRAIVSERYSYVPYIGVFFIVGEFFTYLKENALKVHASVKAAMPYALLLIAILFSILTYQRNKTWKNGEVLFTDEINKYPDEGFSWYALGNSMDIKGDSKAAIADYSKAVDLERDGLSSYFNRGTVYYKSGNLTAALADYSKDIEIEPNFASSYFNRAIIYYKTGDFKNAILDYTQTLLMRPNDTMAYYGRGMAEFSAKQYDSAITDFSKAIELQPETPDYYFNRGNAKYRLKDYKGAIEDNDKGLLLRPDDANAPFNRGLAKYFMNDKEGACKDWQLAQKNGNTNAPKAIQLYCK